MTDEQTPEPEATPTAEREKSPTAWRARRWLVGATLVTVGLAAGGGATYAFTATNNDGARNGTSVLGYGPPAGAPSGRPAGAPPGGQST